MSDQVDFADVKSFLSNAGGHERVVAPVTEATHDLNLLFLS